MKIRSDFVTNSSSSSFMLVVRIGLKNGKVLKFMGDSGVGEYEETYYKLAALKSPDMLGSSDSIEALIQALKESVVSEKRSGNVQVLTDEEPMIQGLRNIQSMDEIDTITVNGDLYGAQEEYQYWHYTFYRDKKKTAYDEGGEDFDSEGTGGRIGFRVSGKKIKGEDFGEMGDDGYHQGTDKDVMIPGEEKKIRQEEGYFNIKDKVLIKYGGNAAHVVIPDGVERIAYHAFAYQRWMESLVIPESVKTIDECAFESCDSLEQVTLKSVPEEIGEEIFTGCYPLSKAILPKEMQEMIENEECYAFEEFDEIEYV